MIKELPHVGKTDRKGDGAPLTLAGVAMYFLPGPGVPVLVIGLSLLTTGLVMAAVGRGRR